MWKLPFFNFNYIQTHELKQYENTIQKLEQFIEKNKLYVPTTGVEPIEEDNNENKPLLTDIFDIFINEELLNVDNGNGNNIERENLFELIDIFDDLMTKSMFGYYAYYEEVKEQIMSFINYFSDAVKERDEALKESKEALKEKEEIIRLMEQNEELYGEMNRYPENSVERNNIKKQIEENKEKLKKLKDYK